MVPAPFLQRPLGWLAGCMGLVLAFYVGLAPVVYNDVWLQIKVGELIAQTGHIPDTLLFPYTEIAEAPFHAHEWLASLFFYGVAHAFGEAALPVLLALLSVAVALLLACLAYTRNGGRLDWALLCALAGLWGENYRHWLRPELLGMLLLLGYWLAAQHALHKRSSRSLALAWALTALWANCHGSFVLAPILAGVYCVGACAQGLWQRRTQQDALAAQSWALARSAGWLLLGTAAASLLNPFGWQLHAFVLQFSTADYVRQYVPEWYSTLGLGAATGRGFWIGMALGLATLLRLLADTLARRRCVTEWLVFLAFTALGAYSVRFLVYFGVVAVFVFSRQRTAQPQRSTVLGYSLATAAAALSFALAFQFGNAYEATPLVPPPSAKFTPGLVDALADTRLHGNVLNSLELGSELVYRAYPRLRPSLDSRIDSYGLDYILYQRALLTQDALFKEHIARYDVRYILLDSVRFGIFSQLPSWRNGDWQILYRSSKEVLLQRRAQPAAPAS